MNGRGRNLSEERDSIRIEVQNTEGLRLDQYVLRRTAWRSRNRVQRLIRAGRILVNGAVAKSSRRIRVGDVVDVRLRAIPLPDWEDIAPTILFEDDDFIALDKPAGRLVHPAGAHVYDTLLSWLHHRARSMEADTLPRLCHRLDRDTTGLLLAAKDPWAHREVQHQFERRLAAKRYLALVVGSYPRETDLIDIPIAEAEDLEGAVVGPARRASRTVVEVLRRFREHTLVACRPLTGRQNQIRIHLALRGHPLAGESRFSTAPTPDDGLPARYLLHAEKLRFWHPRLKATVELSAAPPDDFLAALARLGAESGTCTP